MEMGFTYFYSGIHLFGDIFTWKIDILWGGGPTGRSLSCVVVVWSAVHTEVGRYLGSTRNEMTDLACDLELAYNEAVPSRETEPGIHVTPFFF